MDVAAVNLVAWQHGVVLAAIVLKAEVRAAGDRHLRAMVSAVLPEFPRFGRTHGGARSCCRSHDDLALDSDLRPGGLPAAARRGEAEIFYLAHG